MITTNRLRKYTNARWACVLFKKFTKGDKVTNEKIERLRQLKLIAAHILEQLDAVMSETESILCCSDATVELLCNGADVDEALAMVEQS